MKGGGGGSQNRKGKNPKNLNSREEYWGGGVIYVTMGWGKKKTAIEKSYHSYGFVCSSIYWNHLKWNETLMKTVEPNVVA